MIEYRKGNILDVTEGVIVHGCNCSGGFGSGIAGQIAKKYPDVARRYREAHDYGFTILGNSDHIRVTSDLVICNAYTQQYFGSGGLRYADLAAINKAVTNILFYYKDYTVDVHLPAIGCGLGGLDWETEVKPLYESLGKIYNFVVYEPLQ